MSLLDFASSTPEQQSVILTTEQPLLVIAGPGAGKTKTLVDRVIHLVADLNVPASNIMVATFTEKAAKELVSRISSLAHKLGVTIDISDMYIGTLHSIFLNILEEYRAHTSLARNYRVLDDFEKQYLIFQNADRFNKIENLNVLVNGHFGWNFAKDIAALVSRPSEENLDLEKLSSCTDCISLPVLAALTKEYLEEKRDAERFALIDKEFEEFFGEFLDLEPEEEEEEFKLSLPEEHLSFLKHEADKFIDGVKESLSGMTKSGKLEALAEMQRETWERLLFNFIRDNKDEVFYSVLRSPSNSFLEEERKSQTFINLHKIADAKSFDPENEELMKALKQYDTVLKNAPWAKKHSAYVDKWMNSKAGDKASVFAKLLDAKLKVLSDSVSHEPEQRKKKAHRQDYDMER